MLFLIAYRNLVLLSLLMSLHTDNTSATGNTPDLIFSNDPMSINITNYSSPISSSDHFHLRRSFTKESLLTLVHSFVTSRVDHCNGLLFGSHSHLLDRLQSVLHSAGLEHPQVQPHISCHPRRAPLASNQEKDRLQDRPYAVTAWLVLRRNT